MDSTCAVWPRSCIELKSCSIRWFISTIHHVAITIDGLIGEVISIFYVWWRIHQLSSEQVKEKIENWNGISLVDRHRLNWISLDFSNHIFRLTSRWSSAEATSISPKTTEQTIESLSISHFFFAQSLTNYTPCKSRIISWPGEFEFFFCFEFFHFSFTSIFNLPENCPAETNTQERRRK